ncbi:MAG: pyruvate ferredoxin oxidoreductase [Dehalococcoidia bacterium]|nr:MAG: pyruvate ferredoxin oxidoreductase [Dehalococcoidia bacterium]
MLEIVFHGRGGQGAVTAANLLVAAALKDGHRGLQAFPLFGPERRGAPVKAFARISDSEVNLRSQIYNPDIVVVVDPGLLKLVDVAEGLKADGVLILNTTSGPGDFEFSKSFRVATVDAAAISIRHNLLVGGIPVINTPILGCVPRVTDLVSIGSIESAIKEQWKGEAGVRNALAAREAYEQTEVNR